MSKLTIVADIVAKEGSTDLVKAELLKLVDASRTDEGCINYDLHQDNENPAHFVVYENWASPELLQKHASSAHFVAFQKATDGVLEGFAVHQMSHIA